MAEGSEVADGSEGRLDFLSGAVLSFWKEGNDIKLNLQQGLRERKVCQLLFYSLKKIKKTHVNFWLKSQK